MTNSKEHGRILWSRRSAGTRLALGAALAAGALGCSASAPEDESYGSVDEAQVACSLSSTDFGPGAGAARIAAGAAAQVVTNLNDSGPGSLRQAIASAQNDSSIRIEIEGVVKLASELVVDKTLSIYGPGAQLFHLDGQNLRRVLRVGSAGNLMLRGVTIKNGVAPTTSGSIGISTGGGIYNQGTLSLSRCEITGNRASGTGGGIYNAAGTVSVSQCAIDKNSGGSTGGIDSRNGKLTISTSTISTNSGSVTGGLAAYDSLTAVLQATIAFNSASGTGGLRLDPSATVSNSIISNNTSTGGGSPNCAAPILVGVKNLQYPAVGCGEDSSIVRSANPQLQELALYRKGDLNLGGDTSTHSFGWGSPTVGTGDPSVCTASPVGRLDQLNHYNERCDIGALSPVDVPTCYDETYLGMRTLYRFNNGRDHLYATDSTVPGGYSAEGVAGYTHDRQTFDLNEVARTTALYRLYNPRSGDHFYTESKSERDSALSNGYWDEGTVGYVGRRRIGQSGPFYRLFNGRDHFYTGSLSERNSAMAGGYRDEGSAGYIVCPPNGPPCSAIP